MAKTTHSNGSDQSPSQSPPNPTPKQQNKPDHIQGKARETEDVQDHSQPNPNLVSTRSTQRLAPTTPTGTCLPPNSNTTMAMEWRDMWCTESQTGETTATMTTTTTASTTDNNNNSNNNKKQRKNNKNTVTGTNNNTNKHNNSYDDDHDYDDDYVDGFYYDDSDNEVFLYEDESYEDNEDYDDFNDIIHNDYADEGDCDFGMKVPCQPDVQKHIDDLFNAMMHTASHNFVQATTTKDRGISDAIPLQEECSLCDILEDVQLVTIQDPPTIHKWTLVLEQIETCLLQTYMLGPTISGFIIDYLCTWRTGVDTTDKWTDDLLGPANAQQSLGGHHSCTCGLSFDEWIGIQQCYYSWLAIHNTGKHWTTQIIIKLINISWDLWAYYRIRPDSSAHRFLLHGH